ncbi:DUF6612 family protein [Clostridium sp. MD294]|uniref:DUF6612 family protein n=1 Tax=Clostridium sp. MD294 TaxID=97138 RepID=UPI0002C9C596|nr:DUF6612 family protein [Clostridium sp. MD294]NDO46670.1 hypothetical protein [Clostridium sp. MD294]USF28896.1 hypothetical protein C820_000270 [Clostridium sp. MD294]
MNFCKKVITLISMVVVAFAFSSCGDKAVTQVKSATPQETITKVLENLKQVKSMKSVITTQSNMTAGESVSEVSTQTEVTAVYSPLNMKIVSKSSLPSSNELVTYVDEANGMATTYMEYAGQWMKQSLEPNIVLESLKMYDTKQNAILLLESAADWQQTETNDTFDVLQGVLPAGILAEVVENTKALQMTGMAGLTEEYYKGVLDTTITVTVDKQTLLPTSYTVDLSNTLETLMNNVSSTFGGGTEGNEPVKTVVNEYTLTVDCSDINETKKIEIPKETLDSAIDFERQIENASISEDIPVGENGEELAVE